MQRVALTLVLAGFVLIGGQTLSAKEKDTVYFLVPGKKQEDIVSGKIQEESPAGIKLNTGKDEVTDIPALQIRLVDYGEGVDALGKNDYHSGDTKLTLALRETRAKDRADGLRKALLAFQTLDGNEKLRSVAAIHRYFQFRIAQTLYYQARDDESRRDAAITALKDYKENFADGWEIVLALQSLASLQEDLGDTEAASQTFSDLAKLDGISKEMKLQSQLKGARLMMSIKKYAEAEAKLQAIKLSSDDPQRAFVDAYLIQSRIAQKGNLDGVDTKLQQILRTSKNGSLLALAHNSLGDYYRSKNDLDQAFWEYCKVDMLYNQDREEHAKALFYLSKFSGSRRGKIASHALTRLKTAQFNGTLFQRQAMAEKKQSE